MKTITGDLFNPTRDVEAICIPTNQVVKKNGDLVMGAGVALRAKQLWPELPTYFGSAGDGVRSAGAKYLPNDILINVVSFPTKHHWRDPASIKLIEKSAYQLLELTDRAEWENVCLPIVGCGCGKLSWPKQVRPLLDYVLDSRFTVVFGGNNK